MPDSLLQSKLHPPGSAERLVYRQSLVDRLNRSRSSPVTLISAPAGYGKSTLALQWLQSGKDAFAWLSLDEYDRRLDDIVAYLIGALRTVFPGIAQRTGNLINTPQLPGEGRLSDLLLGELGALPEPVYLVIDDYSTITNAEIHGFMARFIQRLPENLHVVLISRVDPPLSLSRLRGQDQLQEIRGADLRFSSDEAGELLEQITGHVLPEKAVTLLAGTTEGWPFGLRMAGLILRDSDDIDSFTQHFTLGGSRAITDYLLGEVVDHLPDEWRLLLLRTAVSDRFCASLIDDLAADLLQDSSGQAVLEWLWTSNFFVIGLDDQGIWYRYHHLFRQLLDRELRQVCSAEDLVQFHQVAARWFERNGDIEDAVIHMLHAGMPHEAARIIELHVHEMVNRERWRVVERWIKLLPPEAQNSAGLLATRAVIEQFRMRSDAMVALLDEAEQALAASAYSPQERDRWTGVICSLRSSAFVTGNTPPNMLANAEKAIRLLDLSSAFVYSHAELWQISSLQMEGRAEDAYRLVQEKLALASGPVNARIMRLMLAQCSIHFYELDVPGLRFAAANYLAAARHAGQSISIGWSLFLLGWCAYQENELAAAERHFKEAVDEHVGMHMRAAIDSFTGLALTEYALGRTAEAHEAVAALRSLLLQQELMVLLPVVDSLAVRLRFEDGPRRSPAGMTMNLEAQLADNYWELPALTAARMRIAAGRRQDLAEVEDVLAACRAHALSRNNKPQLLQIGILTSLLHQANGRRSQAVQSLRQMVQLAEPGGTLRYFADTGSALIPLLRSLAAEGTSEPYVNRIINAFAQTNEPISQTNAPRPTVRSKQLALDLISELTNREMEVLLLLGQHLTNKEIATRLFISPSTVKKHTISLYQKLDVNGRRQAAVRARELGLI